MRKLLLICALSVGAAIVTPRASAQTAQFVFAPTSFPAAAPGSSISFSINLVFTTGGNINDLFGLTYYLQQNGAAPFVFTLTSRDLSASPFNDPNTTTLTANQALNPSNAQDLGATDTTGMSSGTYVIANITLAISPTAALGTYTLQSTTAGSKTSVVTNSNGDTFAIQPGSLTVTVVPEPSTYALMVFAALGCAFAAYRRKALN